MLREKIVYFDMKFSLQSLRLCRIEIVKSLMGPVLDNCFRSVVTRFHKRMWCPTLQEVTCTHFVATLYLPWGFIQVVE